VSCGVGAGRRAEAEEGAKEMKVAWGFWLGRPMAVSKLSRGGPTGPKTSNYGKTRARTCRQTRKRKGKKNLFLRRDPNYL